MLGIIEFIFRLASRGTTPLSVNSNSNYMGRSSPTLDDLHNENGVYQANGASKPEKLSFKNVNHFSRKVYMMEPKAVGRPTAVNVTVSAENGRSNLCTERRFGAE
jgi:hypothetical protein